MSSSRPGGPANQPPVGIAENGETRDNARTREHEGSMMQPHRMMTRAAIAAATAIVLSIAAGCGGGGGQNETRPTAEPPLDEEVAVESSADGAGMSEPEPAERDEAVAALGEDPCPEVVDHLIALMVDGLGGGPDADEFETAIEAQKPDIVEACRQEYAEDPEGTKPALECALSATTFEELEACPDL